MIDFSVAMVDLETGDVILFPPPKGEGIPSPDSKPLTLKRVAVMALHATLPGEERLAGDEKLRRGLLALDIFKAETAIALKVEDTALIKRLVGQTFGPQVVAQAWPLLDPKAAKAAEPE